MLTDESYTASIIETASFDRHAALARARHAAYSTDLGRTSFRLLEIGCGVAGMADEFATLGVDYTGIDLDPRPIAAAVARGIANVRVGDFLDEPEPPADSTYDVVCLSQVLEHIKRPRVFIEKISRSLASGGLVHLDVPNQDTLAGKRSRLLRGLPRQRCRYGAIEWPHHVFAYDVHSLGALLAPTFDARVFTAVPNDPIWGQPVTPGLVATLYYTAQRFVGARSLVVGYGRRREVEK